MNQLLTQTLIGAAVGGVIGWGTNWLAIKMLFHPRNPIRIGGMTLPGTPGLVVKNQERIAAAVGKSVAHDLLDPQAIRRALAEIKLQGLIEPALRRMVDEFRSDKRPVGEALGAAGSATLRSAFERVASLIAPHLPDFVAGNVGGLLGRPLRDLLPPSAGPELTRLAMEKARAALNSDATGDLIRDKIDGAVARFPHSILAAAVKETVSESLSRAVPTLAAAMQEGVCDYVSSNEGAHRLQEMLVTNLQRMVAQKLPFAASFVTERTLRDMLVPRWPDVAEQLHNAIRSENLHNVIVARLNDGVTEHRDGLFARLFDDADAQIAASDFLAKEVTRMISEWSSSDSATGTVEGAVGSLLDRSLGDFVTTQNIESLVSTHVVPNLPSMAATLANKLLAQPVSIIAGAVPPTESDRAVVAASTWLADKANSVLPDLLHDHLQIEAIVTSKVREFDAQKVEEIIYKVSESELTAIVWIGGVLGVIVGAVGPLLGALLSPTN